MKITKLLAIVAIWSTFAGCTDWLSEDGAPN